MKLRMAVVLSGVAALALGAGVAAQEKPVSKEAQAHIDRAMRLAGDSFMRATANLQCGLTGSAMSLFGNTTVPEATQLFDNLYYVGATDVGAFAIKTSDGVILIDSLNTSEDGVKIIEPGLRKFGLDPAKVKYIVVTHGHGDHYGSASYFAQKYGSRVLMSEADWAFVANPPPPRPGGPPPRFSTPPAKDMVARDGMVLKLGGQEVRMIETPGHTPGTISLLVPVTVKGQKHMLGMWGGTGVPRDPAMRAKYIASSVKFAAAAKKAGADIELSNHPFVDDSLTRMGQLRKAPGKPNPFVIGSPAFARYSAIITECAKAVDAGGPTAN